MKKLINILLAKKGYEIRKISNRSILSSLILERSKKKDFIFMQIGANDGVSFDPIHELVKVFNLRGILLEPVPHHFNSLKKNYNENKDLIFLNKALVDHDSIKSIIIWKPKLNYNDWRKGIASTDKNHLIKCGLLDEEIEGIEVETTTFVKLFDEFKIKKLDLLVVDTEGYDFFLLKSLPFDNFSPAIIHFEHNVYGQNGMSKEELLDLLNILISRGYKLNIDSTDCTAYL